MVILICTALGVAVRARAADIGDVHGVVHDANHRPVAQASVQLKSASSAWSRAVQSDANGEFAFTAVPLGDYVLNVGRSGFLSSSQPLTVVAGAAPSTHVQLASGDSLQTVTVTASALPNAATFTTATLVDRQDIQMTPGADRSNSLAMITDFVPGAYFVHDQLHVRGGHQVTWEVDGVEIPNTNIASNLGPQIDPKDIDYMQVDRGGYGAAEGDRTYGVFNVVPRTGFERDNEADLILSAGNFYSTDNQFNIGGHSERFAWYAGIDGSRSEIGLGQPVEQAIHDQSADGGAFASLLYNASAQDQFRWIVSVRRDHYQVPNDPDAQAAGIRDLDLEGDALLGFHWTHSFSDGVLFTLSPYFHYNNSHYVGGPNDTPFVLDDNDRSAYVGGRSVLQIQKKKHNARVGTEIWAQHDNTFFGLAADPGGGVLNQTERHWANSDAVFLEDQYRATTWLTFDLGLRLTHYGGLVNENAADPRLGAAVRIPKLAWTLHGYYAYYYQPPPLDSLAGPALEFAVSQGFGFIPLPGERDIQHDIGLTVPVHGWSLDIDQFHTSARNFLDHDVIGDSGIFIPLTDLGAIIHGEEVTLRSPVLFHVAQWRVAYSNQIAQGIGPIIGGLLEDAPTGNFLLDHDQRNTVSSVLTLTLPRRMWITPAWQFGSGFLNGDGPAHLPPHSTFDLSIGKRIGEDVTLSANAVNIADTRYLLDTSNTFGGTHYVNPRELYGEIRWRLHW